MGEVLEKGNDECGMMNDELKIKTFQFIVHHSAFIVSLWLMNPKRTITHG
jgi:hypothetical protein